MTSMHEDASWGHMMHSTSGSTETKPMTPATPAVTSQTRETKSCKWRSRRVSLPHVYAHKVLIDYWLLDDRWYIAIQCSLWLRMHRYELMCIQRHPYASICNHMHPPCICHASAARIWLSAWSCTMRTHDSFKLRKHWHSVNDSWHTCCHKWQLREWRPWKVRFRIVPIHNIYMYIYICLYIYICKYI